MCLSSEYPTNNDKLGIKCYAKQIGEIMKDFADKKAGETMNQKDVKNFDQ